jgi:hypothetical protein
MLKLTGIALGCVLVASLPACSPGPPKNAAVPPANSPSPSTEPPARATVRGFGGHLVVVKNPRLVVQNWQTQNVPHIDTAKVVACGETLGALVLFAGCKRDFQGACNTEVDYRIYRPDGTLMAERLHQPLWKETAPPAGNTQLGRGILSFALGQKDPTGEYRVTAKATDLTANTSVELETKFTLQ